MTRTFGGVVARRWRVLPRSIRARLTALAVGVSAVVFGLSSATILLSAPENLRGVLRARVELAVRRVASEARTGRLPGTLPHAPRVHMMQVVGPDRRVLARTADLEAEEPISSFVPARPETIYVRRGRLPGSVDANRPELVFAAILVKAPDGRPVTVYGATSPSDVDRAVTLLYVIVFVGTPLVLVVIAIVTWGIVGLALRPVERVRAELAEITGRDLSRRVPVPDSGDEITRLAVTTNDTLDRLERSADAQRRFVADASHELRSPIAALRTQLDVAAADPAHTDWPATAAQTLAVTDRLAGIVNELLMLARLESGRAPRRTVVDLAEPAHAQVRRRAGARVPVVGRIAGPAPVYGSALQLDRLLTNLLDNAVRHARTRVDLELGVRDRQVVVTVTDDGSGIPPEDRERVFERFTRLSEARERDKGGSGLGLPLSREIAQAHGGSLTIADHEPGAKLVVRLPLYS